MLFPNAPHSTLKNTTQNTIIVLGIAIDATSMDCSALRDCSVSRDCSALRDTPYLSPLHINLLNQADVIVAGQALLTKYAQFFSHSAHVYPIKSPVTTVIEQIRSAFSEHKNCVILTDGDPLCFGFGTTLLNHFNPTEISFIPATGSLQTVAARLKIPWHTTRIISFHGRNSWQPFTVALRSQQHICLLTDAHTHPSEIAQFLIDRGFLGTMHLFYALGTTSEQHLTLELTENTLTATQEMPVISSQMPCTIFLDVQPQRTPVFGIADAEFVTEAKLITKAFVRALGLHMLEIERDSIIWDLGAGSGSVGIEASFLASEGQVFCVEQYEQRCNIIFANRKKLCAPNVEIIHATMPEGLSTLPAPNRIFIGGGLLQAQKEVQTTQQHSLLACITQQLQPKGIVLCHCVLFGSLQYLITYFKELKWQYTITAVNSSHSAPLAQDIHFVADNPVYIFKTCKPSTNEPLSYDN